MISHGVIPGDGVSDTEQIRLALDVARTNRKPVYFPVGQYDIESAGDNAIFNVTNLSLAGESTGYTGTSILKVSDNSATASSVLYAGNGRVQIRGVGVECNPRAMDGIHMYKTTGQGTWIEKAGVSGATHTGWLIEQAQGAVISNVIGSPNAGAGFLIYVNSYNTQFYAPAIVEYQ
ncbi:MAG: glycoside hydrolase family 55 protein [Candidatus Scalindua sp.]|nr:glycoside hydrolase family 55 protein [Candidatus Scalindua sp.]